MKSIQGTVVYQTIEGGFWGIEADNGEQWMIINMPEQIKYKGKNVQVTIEEIDAMSTAMWGTPARIISFRTMMP